MRSTRSFESERETSTQSPGALYRSGGRHAYVQTRAHREKRDVLSLMGFPRFLTGGSHVRTAGPRATISLPEVRRVLGAQRTTVDRGPSGISNLGLGLLPAVALSLVFLATLLLVGSLLPPSLVARTPISTAGFARLRQPLALAATGILAPLALVSLAAALA
jgi:hypothetical protein